MGENGKGIGWAIHAMQGGGKVRRPGWHPTLFIKVIGEPQSTAPTIAIGDSAEKWGATHADLLARDWEVVV